MRKFLIQCLLFSLLLLAINQLLYIKAKALYFGNYGIVDTTSSRFLLADSRGISLNGFPKQYGVANFSSNSDNYIDILRKVKYLIRHTPVKRIYISADDHLLSSYRERTNNQDISIVLTTSEDYNNYFNYVKERYLKYHIVLFQPVVRTIVRTKYEAWVTKNLFTENTEPLISDKERSWESLPEQEKMANASDRHLLQFPDQLPSPKMYQALTMIIKLCKENKVELVGIKFPLTKEYMLAAWKTPFQTDSVFRSHSISILDYRDLYKDNAGFFRNQDHLNDEGGRQFSEMLFK